MKKTIFLKTEQILDDLRRDADNEHQYAHLLSGILRTTHWIEYCSKKDKFGDSTDWSEYYWYTEVEFLDRYKGCWWMREH